jgi:hypothetical protein
MAQFKIEDVGQLRGEQGVVDQSVGSNAKILGTAVETLGGLGKTLYEGYTIGRMKGIAGDVDEVSRLSEEDAEDAVGFTKIVQGLNQGVYGTGASGKKKATVLAVNAKNEAISRAPWMRDTIEKQFDKFFGSTGGRGSGKGGSLFGEDEPTAMFKTTLKMAMAAHERGEINLLQDTTDEEAVAIFAKYQQGKLQLNSIANAKADQVQGQIDNAIPVLVNQFSGKLVRILNSNATAVEKKALLQTQVHSFVSTKMKEMGVDKLPIEQRTAIREQLTSQLEPITTAMSTKEYVTGRINADEFKAKLDYFIESNSYNNVVNNEHLGKGAILRNIVGDDITSIVLMDEDMSLQQMGQVTIKTFGAKGEEYDGAKELVVNKNEKKLQSFDLKQNRQAIRMNGLFTSQEQLSEYYKNVDPDTLENRLNVATNFLDKGLKPALIKTFEDKDIDLFYMNGLEIVPSTSGLGVDINFKEDFTGDKNKLTEAARAFNLIKPDLSGAFVIMQQGGLSPQQAISALRQRIGLEVPTQVEKTASEMLGGVSSTAVDMTTDVLNMDVADYYNTYVGVPFSEGVNKAGKSLKEILEDFKKGYSKEEVK